MYLKINFNLNKYFSRECFAHLIRGMIFFLLRLIWGFFKRLFLTAAMWLSILLGLLIIFVDLVCRVNGVFKFNLFYATDGKLIILFNLFVPMVYFVYFLHRLMCIKVSGGKIYWIYEVLIFSIGGCFIYFVFLALAVHVMMRYTGV